MAGRTRAASRISLLATRQSKRGALAVVVGLALAGAHPVFAAEPSNAELLKRVERLEQKNEDLEKALESERLTEKEPELITRLKDVEFRALSMQKQARTIEALEGVTAGVSFTTVVQHASDATTTGGSESQWNYRADVSVSLPGGEIGNAEGNIFAQFRMGQGDGLTRILPTFSGVNATGFRVQGQRPDDDATVLLAQAWYQLDVPLPLGGFKPRSRETLTFNFGKMDPFLFFDQNAVADDETTRFLNTAFVHNPLLDAGGDVGVDAFGFTPGLRLAYKNETAKPIAWGASLAMFGAGSGATFTDSFEKPFFIAQLDTAQRFFGGLAGNYRVYVWRNGQATPYTNEFDVTTEAHTGWGISADQRVDDAVTLFARYGQQTQGKVRFDRVVTLGAEFGGGYWNRGADAIGVAIGEMRSSDDFRNDAPTRDADGDSTPDFGYTPGRSERVAELYYRMRINPQFEVSPHAQFVRAPGADDSADDIKVVGLRAQATF
ncbi:MAG TPA: carbohydrate porin [Acidiferrobacterales bacterium]|nr:carbohydrate porin [Acidiferrobacterales bacterium]